MTSRAVVTSKRRDLEGKPALATVPKVRLYGERNQEKKGWFVHVGHVTERGRWRTEPHAHPKYGQIIFVRSGRGVMNLEGCNVPFEAPCALLLPTECIHGLSYEVDIDRWVVTVEVSYLAQINAKFQEFIQLWTAPRKVTFCTASDTEFYSLIRRLEHEVDSNAIGHIVGTEAILTMLLLILLRGTSLSEQYKQESPRTKGHDVRLVEHFRNLIDERYREHLQLHEYASMMGVSLFQLRAACASTVGQSPAKMIHSRIITEAKRNLIFGNMSVERIALSLGFTDAAYFTRFFRKEVGQAPSCFRAASRQQEHKAS